jgi:uncharacterized protein
MALMHSEMVMVRNIKGKDRGVFARRPIEEGEIIERVPVIVLPANEVGEYPRESGLGAYVYEWGRGTVALALGYGSLYNHSYEPNALYEFPGRRIMRFVALRTIAPREEITVNYNGKPSDRRPVWFDIVG